MMDFWPVMLVLFAALGILLLFSDGGWQRTRHPHPKPPLGEKRAILWGLGAIALCVVYLVLAIVHII